MYVKGRKLLIMPKIKKLITFFLFLFVCTNVCAADLAIPRFVSFRKDETNLRRGPGNQFPIRFVYRVKNYPVEIIDEYDLWRQIREVDGTIGWVHRRMLSGARYALITDDTVLHKKSDKNSAILAYVKKNVLGKIEKCPAKENFCLISFTFEDKTYSGWIDKEYFYGVYSHEVIE